MAQDKSIGALWVKKNQRGDFMTGYIEVEGQKVEIVCFPNGYKTQEKHPDFRIMISQPRQQRDPVAEEARNQEELNNLGTVTHAPNEEEIDPSTIPF
jgi:hypothetical protein